jgi:hydrogenase-4 component F
VNLALIIVPLAAALVIFVVPSPRLRAWLLPAAGAAHTAMVFTALATGIGSSFEGWLYIGPVAKPILAFVSILFFLSSLYAAGYLRLHPDRNSRTFCACMLALLGMMTVILEARNLGLMWVALEACTLASAPLIYFKRSARSLEAVWKYLLVGSVGIALALLGTFFLAYSALHARLPPTLIFDELVAMAPHLSRPWLHSAFVLLFIGYGTKMGLAPMHTWKPDAYGESPGLVGALLAGGVTSCAFLAILRFYKICAAAGEQAFARQIMITAGLLSMAVAGIFMARQRDYKRMLAYSSVEHMGILVLGIGIGGAAVFGAMLHLVNNGLTKGVLFLSAANIHRAYASKSTDDVSGALRRLPASGGLFLAGFFAVTGSPPFGPFLSEFTIVSAAFTTGHVVVGTLFLFLLIVVFVGMGATVLAVVHGPPRAEAPAVRESFLTTAPIFAFMALVLLLGVYLPRSVDRLLEDAAADLSAEATP